MFDFILFSLCFIVSLILIFKFFNLLADLFLFVLGVLSDPRSFLARLLTLASTCLLVYLDIVYDNILFFIGAVFFGSVWLIWFASLFISSDDETSQAEDVENSKPTRTRVFASPSSWLGTGALFLAAAWLLGRNHHHEPPPPHREHEEENTEIYETEDGAYLGDANYDADVHYDDFNDYGGDGDW